MLTPPLKLLMGPFLVSMLERDLGCPRVRMVSRLGSAGGALPSKLGWAQCYASACHRDAWKLDAETIKTRHQVF